MRIPQPIRMLKRRLLRKSEGDRVIVGRFRDVHNRDFDPANVRTFSEKLYQRLLRLNRNNNPMFTRLADKLQARDYVAERVGSQYLTHLIWSGPDPKQIPFDRLPAKSIAKTNHASARNIVLKHPINRQTAIATMSGWLKENYYWAMREGHYYDIKPRILVESFLDDGQPKGPLDYRFWCFDGNIELIQIDNNLHSINAFYDRDWNKLPIRFRDTGSDCDVMAPANLATMIRVASILSSGIDFVRVDLYSCNAEVYFGELTFVPAGGCYRFQPVHWETYLGEKWVLPSGD